MQITVKKWGNSAAVRLPARVVNAAQVGIEQRVEVRVEGRKIVLDPAIEEDSLDALLAQITPENVHHEIDFGSPVGKEFFRNPLSNDSRKGYRSRLS